MDEHIAQLLGRHGGNPLETLQSLLGDFTRHASTQDRGVLEAAQREAAREAARELGIPPEALPDIDQILAMGEQLGAAGGATPRGGEVLGGAAAPAGREDPPPQQQQFRVGQRVTVGEDVERNRRLAAGHGGWNPAMAEYCGQTGDIQRVDRDGDVSVVFGDGRRFTWNPACLTLDGDAGPDPDWQPGHGTVPPYAPWRVEQCRGYFRAELARLAEMGHREERSALRALIRHRGDVELSAAMIASREEAAAEAAEQSRRRQRQPLAAGQLETSEAQPVLELAGAQLAVSSRASPLQSPVEPQPQPQPGDADSGASWWEGIAVDVDGAAPAQLCDAVLRGDLQTVQLFLAQPGASGRLWLVDDDVKLGECELLRAAAVEGHTAICAELLSHGAVLERVVQRLTPLHSAVWAGHAAVVSTLHQAGADVNTVARVDGAQPSAAPTAWRVRGAGTASCNGTYRPCQLDGYRGAQVYSNGQIHLFRWQQQHWVLSDLGPSGQDFDESRWLYCVPCGPGTALPPLTAASQQQQQQQQQGGWERRLGSGPVPTVMKADNHGDTPPPPAASRTSGRVANVGSPLWLAAKCGHAAVVRMLLGCGARLDSPGPRGDTAAKRAAGAERNALVRQACTHARTHAHAWFACVRACCSTWQRRGVDRSVDLVRTQDSSRGVCA
jgi:hypothetical protein